MRFPSALQRVSPYWRAYACLLLIPFVFSRSVEDPFHAPRWSLLALAAAGLAFRLRRDARPPLPPAALAWLAGWLLLSCASVWSAADKAEGLWQASRDAAWAAWLVCLAAAAGRDPSLPDFLRRGAVISALLGSAIAAGQYWGWWAAGEGLGTGPGGLQGNRNLLASAQLLFCPWILWAMRAETGVWRLAAWGAWAAFAYVLAVTQCRAVWMGGLAMAACILALAWRFAPPGLMRRERVRLGAMACILAAAFLIQSRWKPGHDDRAGNFRRVASVADAGNASNSQRLALWGKSLALIGAHPWLGVGAGNWKIDVVSQGLGGTLWPDMRDVEVRPYNDWLWTAAESGIPAAACRLGLWGFALLCGWRALRRGEAVHRAPAVLLSAGLIGFAAVSALDFPRERPEHMAWLAASMAMLFALGGNPAAAGTGSRPLTGVSARTGMPWTVPAALSLAVGASALSLWRWDNEAIVRDALQAQRAQDWPGVIAACDRLDRRICDLNPAATPMDWHAGIAHWQLGDGAGAEAAFRAAMRIHPWHIHVLYNLSVVRLAAGDSVEAEALLRRAIAISPGFAPASMNLALMDLRRGRRDRARAILATVAAPQRDEHWNRIDRALARTERITE